MFELRFIERIAVPSNNGMESGIGVIGEAIHCALAIVQTELVVWSR